MSKPYAISTFLFAVTFFIHSQLYADKKKFIDSNYIQRSCSNILASATPEALVVPGAFEQQLLMAVETPDDVLQFAIDQGLIFTTASLYALARTVTELAAAEYMKDDKYLKMWSEGLSNPNTRTANRESYLYWSKLGHFFRNLRLGQEAVSEHDFFILYLVNIRNHYTSSPLSTGVERLIIDNTREALTNDSATEASEKVIREVVNVLMATTALRLDADLIYRNMEYILHKSDTHLDGIRQTHYTGAVRLDNERPLDKELWHWLGQTRTMYTYLEQAYYVSAGESAIMSETYHALRSAFSFSASNPDTKYLWSGPNQIRGTSEERTWLFFSRVFLSTVLANTQPSVSFYDKKFDKESAEKCSKVAPYYANIILFGSGRLVDIFNGLDLTSYLNGEKHFEKFNAFDSRFESRAQSLQQLIRLQPDELKALHPATYSYAGQIDLLRIRSAIDLLNQATLPTRAQVRQLEEMLEKAKTIAEQKYDLPVPSDTASVGAKRLKTLKDYADLTTAITDFLNEATKSDSVLRENSKSSHIQDQLTQLRAHIERASLLPHQIVKDDSQPSNLVRAFAFERNFETNLLSLARGPESNTNDFIAIETVNTQFRSDLEKILNTPPSSGNTKEWAEGLANVVKEYLEYVRKFEEDTNLGFN